MWDIIPRFKILVGRWNEDFFQKSPNFAPQIEFRGFQLFRKKFCKIFQNIEKMELGLQIMIAT